MRIRPSAPTPNWRWQTRRANSGCLGLRDEALPVVDEHEIVAPAVHLVKGNGAYEIIIDSPETRGHRNFSSGF